MPAPSVQESPHEWCSPGSSEPGPEASAAPATLSQWTKAAVVRPGGDPAALERVTLRHHRQSRSTRLTTWLACTTPTPCRASPPCAAPGHHVTPVRPWTIRQYAGFSTAEESQRLLSQGPGSRRAGRVSVAFDLATHRGYDSDHPRVTGDVGKAGVAVDSVEDMKILFDGIPLDKVSRLHDHERRRAADPGELRRRGRGAGRASDPAGQDHPERHPQGVHGPQHLHLPARTQHADRRRHHRVHGAEMPKFNSISISGYHMQEAGANQALELAFTLADGKE